VAIDSVFQSLTRSGRLSPAMFSLWLNGSRDGSTIWQNGGELTLGGYKPSRFSGALTWLDIPFMPRLSYKYFWSLNMTSFTISSQNSSSSSGTLRYTFSQSAFGVLDSGRSSLSLPRHCKNYTDTQIEQDALLLSWTPTILTQSFWAQMPPSS
jgi:hypothetical protein